MLRVEAEKRVNYYIKMNPHRENERDFLINLIMFGYEHLLLTDRDKKKGD